MKIDRGLHFYQKMPIHIYEGRGQWSQRAHSELLSHHALSFKSYRSFAVCWQQPAHTTTFTVTVLELPPASVTVTFTKYVLCLV
jgi:hypothetical protein